uniref:Uncharacterized protein n=1 Tax=Anguilla anguilla TaxID=7936 RepID=A0A0E9VJ39_ANGAN
MNSHYELLNDQLRTNMSF